MVSEKKEVNQKRVEEKTKRCETLDIRKMFVVVFFFQAEDGIRDVRT